MGQNIPGVPKFFPGDTVTLLPSFQKSLNNYFEYTVFQIRPFGNEEEVKDKSGSASAVVGGGSKKRHQAGGGSTTFEQEVILVQDSKPSIKFIYPISYLQLKKTGSNIQRRTEFSILKKYLTFCEKNEKFKVVSNVVDYYNKKIFEGKPVKVMDLSLLDLTDEYIKPLGILINEKESSIYELNLSKNQLTSQSCTYISKWLITNPLRLRVLNLSFNKGIGTDGIEHIAKALKVHQSLSNLNFESCGIGHSGISEILYSLISNSQLPLQRLNLRNNNCGDRQVELALKLVDNRMNIVELELSPHVENKKNEKKTKKVEKQFEGLEIEKKKENKDGWLSLKGWEDFLKLKQKVKQNDFRRKSLDNKNQIKCNICLEEKQVEEIYILDECYHKFCFPCLREYVITKIKNFETDSIRCPQCSRVCSVIEIRQILSGDSGTTENFDNYLERFHQVSLKKALVNINKSNEKLLWCPNSKCENAFIVNMSDFEDKKEEKKKDEEESKKKEMEIPKKVEKKIKHKVPPVPKKSLPKKNVIKISKQPGLTEDDVDETIRKLEEELMQPTKKKSYEDEIYNSALSSYHTSSIERKVEKDQQYNKLCQYQMPLDSNFPMNNNQIIYPKGYNQQSLLMPNGRPQTVMMDGFVVVPEKQKTKKGSKTVKCSSCGLRICVLCEKEAHYGLTCEEAKSAGEKESEKMFKKWATENNTKPCPECKRLIQKDDGCNHMKCSVCGCEFCWLCLEKTDTKDGHFKVGGKCPQWSLNIAGFNVGIPHL